MVLMVVNQTLFSKTAEVVEREYKQIQHRHTLNLLSRIVGKQC